MVVAEALSPPPPVRWSLAAEEGAEAMVGGDRFGTEPVALARVGGWRASGCCKPCSRSRVACSMRSGDVLRKVGTCDRRDDTGGRRGGDKHTVVAA